MKIVEPKQVYYECDICDRRWNKDNKPPMNKIKYKKYFDYTFINRGKGWKGKKLYICQDCFREMQDYIWKKVKENDEA